MHETSMNNMRYFREAFVKTRRVLDVGSRDVNGTYRGLFHDVEYVGLDMAEGPGVDLTSWDDIADNSFDYVISGQTFEHVEDDFALMTKMAAALKPGGVCCVIAPSAGPAHDYPQDYRRYKPENMIILAEHAGLRVLEAKINGEAPWFDCVLVAQKRGAA